MSYPARAEGLGKYDKGALPIIEISRIGDSLSGAVRCYTKEIPFFGVGSSYLFAGRYSQCIVNQTNKAANI